MRRTAAITAAVSLGAAVALALEACAVGPNYGGAPSLGEPASFKRAPESAPADEPVARWWTELHDPELDALVDKALASSPSVDAALARVREARGALAEERAKALPNTGLSAAALRAHNLTSALGAAPNNGSADTNIYAVAFDATWEVDLFGAHRRAVEGAAASFMGSRASLRDASVTLSAEVAEAYIELRDAQQRLLLTQRSVEIDRQLLDLMRRRRAAGVASELDEVRVRQQLESTQASIGPLQSARLEQMDRLCMLTGRLPGSLDGELDAAADMPLPPTKVVIGDPASLLRRRPDIVIAERKLAQQTAVIGQDIAALFPKLTLLGDVGFTAPTVRSLFNGSSFTYVAAPLLQWTPFDFGRNRARIGEARAARDEAEADYRRTVLSALEDAESALSRFGQQRSSVSDLARVRESSDRAYVLTDVRLRAGTAATTDLLDADSERVQAQLNYQQALAQLSEDFVSLQKSLGLGWVDAEG